MRRARLVLLAATHLAIAVSAGCRSAGDFADPPSEAAPGVDQSGLPSYAQIAEAYNQRAAMLDRVWARCSASFTFEDENGDRQSEQGEGHLQIVQPDRFALSIGKLGEVLLWVGGDRERYWLIERLEDKRAYVGRYSQLTPDKAARIGLPVYPNEMMRLLGVVPMPADADAIVYRFRDGDLVVSIPAGTTGDGEKAAWFYKLDALTFEPRAIRLKVGRRVIVESELSDDIRVEKEGTPVGPTIAKRSLLTHRPSGASMNIQLDDSVSDGKGRLNANAFKFEFLVDALGPLEVIDVDDAEAQGDS